MVYHSIRYERKLNYIVSNFQLNAGPVNCWLKGLFSSILRKNQGLKVLIEFFQARGFTIR